MKKKTELKKLRIAKETLLSLETRQLVGVAGGGTRIAHDTVDTFFFHVSDGCTGTCLC